MLVQILKETGHEFPKISWYQLIQLDLAESATDGVTGFDMALSSRGSEVDRWSDFVRRVEKITQRDGYANLRGPMVRSGGAPAYVTLTASDGRTLEVSGDKGTIINLHVDATRFDDRNIQTGVIWRDGKNVMDAGAIH